MDPKLLLVDTDCGIDDAQAILLAAMNPNAARIVALTTVEGKEYTFSYKQLL